VGVEMRNPDQMPCVNEGRKHEDDDSTTCGACGRTHEDPSIDYARWFGRHIQTFDDLCLCGAPWPCSLARTGQSSTHKLPMSVGKIESVTITISREDAEGEK
jgi:hypothetical protein